MKIEAEQVNMQLPSRELADTVLRQGEIRLDAQLRIALAADQRAITSAAILIGIGTALLGLAGNQATDGQGNPALALGALVTSIGMLLASGFCVAAAWPVGFDLAGANPANWWEDNVINKQLETCLEQETYNYSRRIEHNRKILARNAARLRRGMLTACTSPIIGLVAWSVVLYL